MSSSSWSITYGDLSGASGNVGTDSVTVGGITVKNQAIEIAQKTSRNFATDATAGIVGLAFQKINQVRPAKQHTIFENMVSQNVLAAPTFAVHLKKGASGSYDFGFTDATKFKAPLHYTTIDTSAGFWDFPARKYIVDGTSFENANGKAIIDTGTTLMLVPSQIVKAYYAKVSGAGFDELQQGYTFPCNAKMPSFQAQIGDYMATIPGSVLNFGQVSATSKS
jgi:Eukaryotic aspartyl protease